MAVVRGLEDIIAGHSWTIDRAPNRNTLDINPERQLEKALNCAYNWDFVLIFPKAKASRKESSPFETRWDRQR